MNRLEQVMAYICQAYPFKDELSDARLTKLVYLTDWFHAIYTGEQATEIKWIFNHYGPYVRDVYDLASNSYNFRIDFSQNYYGDSKAIIYYVGMSIRLDKNSEIIINRIIDKTKSMYFNEFIDYVYSTYPIKNNDRYSILDLSRLASEYNR
jgi:hypothetical protein